MVGPGMTLMSQSESHCHCPVSIASFLKIQATCLWCPVLSGKGDAYTHTHTQTFTLTCTHYTTHLPIHTHTHTIVLLQPPATMPAQGTVPDGSSGWTGKSPLGVPFPHVVSPSVPIKEGGGLCSTGERGFLHCGPATVTLSPPGPGIPVPPRSPVLIVLSLIFYLFMHDNAK